MVDKRAAADVERLRDAWKYDMSRTTGVQAMSKENQRLSTSCPNVAPARKKRKSYKKKIIAYSPLAF